MGSLPAFFVLECKCTSSHLVSVVFFSLAVVSVSLFFLMLGRIDLLMVRGIKLGRFATLDMMEYFINGTAFKMKEKTNEQPSSTFEVIF